MKFRTRAMVAAAALSGFALAATPMISQAQEAPISDAIAFIGTATVSSTSGCIGPFVCISGGGGGYTFNSIVAACYSDGDAVTDVPEVTVSTVAPPCSISSIGSYTNTVCGTGSATGTATLQGEPEGNSTASFTISFDATVGVLSGTLSSAGEATPETLTGVVLLSAPPPGGPIPSPTANQCSAGFTVTGAAVATGGAG